MTASCDHAVQVHIADPWASVPIRLLEAGCGLTPLARLTLIYMLDLGRRPGWTIYAGQARRALGLTEGRWKRTRRELEQHGYFVKHRGHAADGDWLWTYHLYDTPQVTIGDGGGGQFSIGAKRTDANCTGAKRIDRRKTTSCSSTRQNKKEAAAEVPRAVREAPAPAAAGAAAGEKKPKRQRVVAGCTCWTPEDLQLVEELTKVHGAVNVRAVANELRAAGIDPLPSVVARVLQERARAALKAAAERKAEQREAAKRNARAAAKVERDARRDDPETRARIAALIKETARKVGGYRY